MPNENKNSQPTNNSRASTSSGKDSITLSKQVKTNSSNQPTKWILFFLLVVGVGLFSESLYKKLNPSSEPTGRIDIESKNHFVSRDLYKLHEAHKIPRYFFQLKDIEWSYYDEDLENQIPKNSIPFETSAAGKYILKIDVFSAPQGNAKIAILQMNVVDSQNGNKVFELSRDYEIKNKK